MPHALSRRVEQRPDRQSGIRHHAGDIHLQQRPVINGTAVKKRDSHRPSDTVSESGRGCLADDTAVTQYRLVAKRHDIGIGEVQRDKPCFRRRLAGRGAPANSILANEILVGGKREFEASHLRRHIGVEIMAIGQKPLFDSHRGLRESTDGVNALFGKQREQPGRVTGGAGQLPPGLADIGQARSPHRQIADQSLRVLEITDPVHPSGADGIRDPAAVRPAEPKHGKPLGDIGDHDIRVLGAVVANPGQVTLHRAGADHQPEMILGEAEDGEIALDPALVIQHQRVAGAPDRPVDPVGADRLQTGQRIRPGHVDLAEARQLGDAGGVMRRGNLGADMIEPVRPSKGQGRLFFLVEIEGPLEAEHLAEMRAPRHPFIMERQPAKLAGGAPLAAGIGDLVMLAKNLRHPFGKRRRAVHRGIEPLRIGLVQIGRRRAMLNGVGQRHARTASRGHPDGIHPASKEQAARLGGLAKKEAAVRGETLRSVQQHLHLGMFEAGKPVKRVMHHRLEMVPILGQQLEGEVGTDPPRVDGLARRLETPDQQPARIITDIEMAVMIGQRRKVPLGPRHRLGQKIEMLAGPDRHLGPGHGGGLAAPQPGTERHGIASDRAAVGLDADDPAAFGQDAGNARILENARTATPRALDKGGAQVRRADPAVIRRPDSADHIIHIHQRPAFRRLASRNGVGLHPEQACQRRLPAHMDHPVLIGGDRQRSLVDPAHLLAGFLFKT